jgi:hypothetical protein
MFPNYSAVFAAGFASMSGHVPEGDTTIHQQFTHVDFRRPFSLFTMKISLFCRKKIPCSDV